MTTGAPMADVSDERLAELIADVEAEFIADTKAAWVEARRRYKSDHLLALRELLALRSQARDGYVLVPVEPTQAMLDSWSVPGGSESERRQVYRAMLSAAPKGEPSQEGPK